MEVLILDKLKNPTYFEVPPREMAEQNPLFCNSCYNLSFSSVDGTIDPNISLNSYILEPETRAAIEAGPLEASTPIPHSGACQLHIHLTYLQTTADDGCETCIMMRTVIEHLGGGAILYSDPSLVAEITFRRGLVLRVEITRLHPEDVEEEFTDDLFIWGPHKPIGRVIAMIGKFELYTLRGMSLLYLYQDNTMIPTIHC